jgi:hypothetical protein
MVVIRPGYLDCFPGGANLSRGPLLLPQVVDASFGLLARTCHALWAKAVVPQKTHVKGVLYAIFPSNAKAVLALLEDRTD